MSLYNMINGVQPATFFFLPMLGKHPDQYPRFRDCFIGKMTAGQEKDEYGIPDLKHGEERKISVYTRVGGGNRDDYEKEISELRSMPTYLEDFDDDFDCTFATFVFSIPKEFEADFDKLKDGKIKEISDAYRKRLYEVYPKLKEKFDEIFTA